MDGRSLHIQLLGAFRMSVDATPVNTLHAPRIQALLAYLALHREAPQPRRQIAFLLWPDSAEPQALTNLRNLIHQLRHTLPNPDGYLDNGGPTLQWRADGACTLDVAAFEHALAQADMAAQSRPEALRATLEAAIVAYGGDLLPTCYDEWIVPIRERLRQGYLGALARLITLLEAQRAYPEAIGYAQRLIQLEPLHEAVYLQLLRLHALNGDRASAIATYHACAEALQRELAVEPGQPLREAYARLHNDMSAHEPAVGPIPGPALVGRSAAWRQLLQIWRAAATGRPQLLILSGEAGIGKTRLAEEALQWVARQGYPAAHAACYPGEAALAYAPLIAWLRAAPVSAALTTLAAPWLTELGRLLPELHTLRPDLPPAGPLSEPWQRQRLFEALRLAVLAAGSPLLLVIDDLQWCDYASLDWLRYLLRDDPPARLLLIATVRPEEVQANSPLAELMVTLQAQAQATSLAIGPLDSAETAALAAAVAGAPLSTAQAAAVYQETEGNPLFVVEMMRVAGEESRAQSLGGPDDAQRLPRLSARVQAVIARRLALLSPPAHTLAGAAATIGCAFSLPVLSHVCHDQDQAALRCGLDELLQRRIVREQAGGTYDFSHARLREVAYAELSATRRRGLHAQVAGALQADRAVSHTLSARQALHYVEAGYLEAAIRSYLDAAAAAHRIYANAEAIRACRRALALLSSAPNELEPQVARALAGAAQATIGDALAALELHAEARVAYLAALDGAGADLARASLQRRIGNTWRAQAQFAAADAAYRLAAAALAGPVADPAPDAWQERIALQLDQLEGALWQGPAGAISAEEIAQLQAVVACHGTRMDHVHLQFIRLYWAFWADRCQVDDAQLAQLDTIRAESERLGDGQLIATAYWVTGQAHLVRHDLDRVEAPLAAALAMAEHAGNLQIEARCLISLNILRRRRRGSPSEAVAQRIVAIAAPHNLADCLGAIEAERAWLAWRAADSDAAVAHGRQALEHWQQSSVIFPFEWTARLPLCAMALEQGRPDRAAKQLQALLAPTQQRFPEPLEAALQAALQAYAQGRSDLALAELRPALALAQRLGFL